MKNSAENLKLLVLSNCSELGNQINIHLKEMMHTDKDFIARLRETRFYNGEGKVEILDSIRQKDVYILSDIGNHSMTYTMYGYENHMNPDSHLQDIKRTLSAIKGHTKSITLIMPLLYAERQHRRKSREPLECAVTLQELEALGVTNIIVFDVHDPDIQNAIPLSSFENFYPTNVILNKFIHTEPIDFKKLTVVSPDTGAMDRAGIYADILGANVGMFYKRRDRSRIVDGKNPIVAHQYMGGSVKGKDVIVVDDMIASGQSMLEVAERLKKKGARNIYLIASFALFDRGPKAFDEAFAKGDFAKVYSTNLSYIAPEIRSAPWFEEVDMSHYLAQIIKAYHEDASLSPYLNNRDEIFFEIQEYKAQQKNKK